MCHDLTIIVAGLWKSMQFLNGRTVVFVDVSWTLPAGSTRKSLTGCVTELRLNDDAYILTESFDQTGIVAGCPGIPTHP